jgi:GxxExxY protein
VQNQLGCGFLEKVYENALAIELKKAGIPCKKQTAISIKYDGQEIGDYICDFLVDITIIGELKAVKQLDDIHMAQCINYLKAANLKLCLLLNFGTPKVQIKRIVNKI